MVATVVGVQLLGKHDAAIRLRVAVDADRRILALLHTCHLLFEHATHHRDADIGLPQMFEVALRNLALPHPGHEVLHQQHFGHHPAVFILERNFIDRHPLLPLYRHAGTVAVVGDVQGMSIVQRDAPLVGAVRAQDVREYERVADGPVLVGLALTFHDAALHDALRKFVEADLHMARAVARDDWLALAFPDIVHVATVQPLHMHRIERVLDALQPVAGQRRDADMAHDVVPDQQIQSREQGRRLRTEIGEHQTA